MLSCHLSNWPEILVKFRKMSCRNYKPCSDTLVILSPKPRATNCVDVILYDIITIEIFHIWMYH